MDNDNVSEYTLKRALRVYEIYQAHYESGSHSRSSRWVYFHRVRPVYAISETTYKRYLKIARDFHNQEAVDDIPLSSS